MDRLSDEVLKSISRGGFATPEEATVMALELKERRAEKTARWVDVNDRLPEAGYSQYLKWVYGNGNSGIAVGVYDDETKEWEIEYSDDHPGSEDIKYWLEEPETY